jgi:hypothetical protein
VGRSVQIARRFRWNLGKCLDVSFDFASDPHLAHSEHAACLARPTAASAGTIFGASPNDCAAATREKLSPHPGKGLRNRSPAS